MLQPCVGGARAGAQGEGEGEDARVKEQDAATRGAATPLGAFKVKESIVLDRGREGTDLFLLYYSFLFHIFHCSL